jgi:hypothetical protein
MPALGGTAGLRVIDILRRYTPSFVARHAAQAAPQVHGVLAKLSLCRTAALGGHVCECPRCGDRCPVYNSCLDRHCPQCRGGRRAAWLDQMAKRLLPGIDYFQVVFTVPQALSALMLGHRRATYALLFRAAWAALRDVVREEVGCEPAAWMVLHTWNQRLEHHPHLHALVPGGGPSLDCERWVTSGSRQPSGRRRPYLVDHVRLSNRFRDEFVAGLKRLHQQGELKLTGAWSPLQDAAAFRVWLHDFTDHPWVVYIEPPPTADARPEHVLKYLARYLTGGPMADRRLRAHAGGQVQFWARSKDKQAGNPPEPYELSGIEFTRRWSLHILPRGFVKSRGFGGFSGRQGTTYLRRCRDLLRIPPATAPETVPPAPTEAPSPPLTCPHCQTPLACVNYVPRPSWREVLWGVTRPWWYERRGGRAPPEG